MLLTIYTLPHLMNDLQELIQSQDRMDELVAIKDLMIERPIQSGNVIIVDSRGISFPIDWYNAQPPYLLQEFIWFQEETLLGIIYAKLGNEQAARAFLPKQGALLAELNYIQQLRSGQPVDPQHLAVETYQAFDDYRLMHNHAIVRHFGTGELSEDLQKSIHYYYNAAIDAAPTVEHQAFSAKYYVSFLIDIQALPLAEKIATDTLKQALSKDAQIALKQLLTQIWMQQLHVPYDQDLLAKLKENLWEVLQAYEQRGSAIEAALALTDACYIASISNSFAEALGYINRAIQIFEAEEQEELGYEAQFKKGFVMFTWATNGQPQFYRSAIEPLQQALRYFTKQDFPDIYAEIHHFLGVIYSEIPDEVKKKSIWAAVSSSSFQEALSVFTKEETPYQYALVCNSFGNALTKYPAAIHSDNYEKALFYYNEALEIRNAEEYPMERVLSLLNYLEASWYADNGLEENNLARYYDMKAKVEEVLQLTTEPNLLEDAQLHQQKLAVLAQQLALE